MVKGLHSYDEKEKRRRRRQNRVERDLRLSPRQRQNRVKDSSPRNKDYYDQEDQ